MHAAIGHDSADGMHSIFLSPQDEFSLLPFVALSAVLFSLRVCPILFGENMVYCGYDYHHHLVPCLHCHPHSYIRMVQHLIERCLLLHMNQNQCVKALAQYASIRPCITITVWRELEKENTDFFEHIFMLSLPSGLSWVGTFKGNRVFKGRNSTGSGE
ncbi:Plant-specific transcription factor YABBY family protein [Hibiscus syriacus]|uniref:Plant-specific transcription factor YABBY family protein n=1 Tax=Hibiscus syriacus TaxID=106335 RepID=A0A6A3A5M9_HIBSY|nr:Plant-specific transcription factor YABBY family protein [Hibiscus syriacus]